MGMSWLSAHATLGYRTLMKNGYASCIPPARGVCGTIPLRPCIVGRRCLHVCYDCLCLMALFRDAMLLVHDWAALSMWTGTETGYCQTITWELGC